jgi:hypothetical protein
VLPHSPENLQHPSVNRSYLNQNGKVKWCFTVREAEKYIRVVYTRSAVFLSGNKKHNVPKNPKMDFLVIHFQNHAN